MANNGTYAAADLPPELSEMMEDAAQPVRDVRQPITLQELRRRLEDDYDVKASYDFLSTLINQGNIAEQLQIGGTKARREIPPDVAPILADFIVAYREGKGRLPQAPAMLESFLRSRIEKPAIDIPATLPGEVNPAALAYLSGWSQGRARGLAESDMVMTAREAADFLGITPKMLRKTVKPFRRFGNSSHGDRWRRSDLLSSDAENAVRDVAARSIADVAGVLEAPAERKALPAPDGGRND